MSSSNTSLANFSNVLGSVKEARDVGRPPEPHDLILNLLKGRGGLYPLSELRDETKLRDDVILEAVERLRGLRLIEVVTLDSPQKFLKMTPAGYAKFA